MMRALSDDAIAAADVNEDGFVVHPALRISANEGRLASENWCGREDSAEPGVSI
jgi:hypothetical protein